MIEKEAYAIEKVEQLSPYLYGRRFQILSDHKRLQELFKKQETFIALFFLFIF
jgi:hypothetical protein